MKNIGAFFDIDGTIYRDSLMDENFKKLMRHEVIDEDVWHREVKTAYHNWKKRRGDYDTYLEVLAKVYLENLVGVDMEYLEFLAKKTIEDYYESVYRYSRHRLRWHKEENHKIFFISGSPEFLVKEMAKKYYATDYRGTKCFVDDENKFTGKIKKMWNSESKHEVVLEFAKEYDIDLEKSFAYGDTNGDFSMLKLVGNPIAINPNRELLKNIKSDESLSKRTKIAVERKDNIYIFDSSVQILDIPFC